jgi:hypothetical protein
MIHWLFWIVVSLSIPQINDVVNINSPSGIESSSNIPATLEYNYITTQDYIESNIQKYQDILP